MAIITACVNLVKEILSAVLYFLIPRQAVTDVQENRQRDSQLATQFIQNFVKKYGNVHPEFFHGTLSEVIVHYNIIYASFKD